MYVICLFLDPERSMFCIFIGVSFRTLILCVLCVDPSHKGDLRLCQNPTLQFAAWKRPKVCSTSYATAAKCESGPDDRRSSEDLAQVTKYKTAGERVSLRPAGKPVS